ncbi:MAG: PAS domain S-box protein [Balneolaceae bacterium]
MVKRESIFTLSALKIVLIYLGISLLWIIYTDRLVDMLFEDPLLISRVQTGKGWFFVISTSFFLWWLIKRFNRDLEYHRNRFRDMLNNSGVGMVYLKSGRIDSSNSTFKRLFGYSEQELQNQPFQELFSRKHRRVVQDLMAKAENQTESVVEELQLKTSTGESVWIHATFSSSQVAGEHLLEAIVMDIQEKKEYQIYTDLLLQIILSLEPAKNVNAALATILKNICEEVGWEYGAALVPKESDTSFHKVESWFSREDELSDYDKQVGSYEFKAGEGLVGITVKSKKPQWVEDLRSDERFLEKEDAEAAGLHTVLSVPVVVNEYVIAVLMLFHKKKLAADPGMIRFFSAIGSDIGTKLDRKREKEIQEKILENIPVMMVLYHPSLSGFTINKEFQRVTGWSDDEASKRDLLEKIYPNESVREAAVEFMHQPDGSWKDFEMRTRSGETIYTTWTNIRLSDETQIGIGLDITEKKRAEQLILRSMLEGTEQERARVATELHDGLGQYLAAARLQLESVYDLLSELKPDAGTLAQFEKGLEHLRHAMEETKRISRNLIPKAIEDFGLVHAIESLMNDLQESTDITYAFHSNLSKLSIPNEMTVHLYRIIQEAVHNAIRHSGCSRIDVQLVHADGNIYCTVEDDGTGFDTEERRGSGLGLNNVKSRVMAMNGEIEIKSESNKGTVILIELPSPGHQL